MIIGFITLDNSRLSNTVEALFIWHRVYLFFAVSCAEDLFIALTTATICALLASQSIMTVHSQNVAKNLFLERMRAIMLISMIGKCF